MNRIGPGISESDELAESAGRGGKPGFALPSKADVHGMDIVVQRLEINAVSFERPRPIDHVGQNGDASRADGLIEEPIATVLVICRRA